MTATVEKEQVNDVRIRDLMERWERWRHDKPRLGYGKSILQKCLEGMPGTNCPTCAGRGKTRVYPVCPTCSGIGRIKLDPSATQGKVNPAFIASTHRLPDDEVSEKIDKLLCLMRADEHKQSYYFVLMQEYTRSGTQEIKADRMLISYAYYKKLLYQAHEMLKIGLDLVSKDAKNAHNRQ